MKQKVIVVDGTDGCGKATQTQKLYQVLTEKGHTVRYLEFPRYEDAAAVPVKRYLSGEYGETADAVNPYAASTLYAVDRFDCFAREPVTEEIILADRYTTSNMIHQASKLEGEERRAFTKWLEDLEYNKLSIPEPDLVFFLDLPPGYSEKLIETRSQKTQTDKDIHEKDNAYLERSYQAAKELAEEKEWEVIDCTTSDGIRNIDDIHQEILDKVDHFLGNSEDV